MPLSAVAPAAIFDSPRKPVRPGETAVFLRSIRPRTSSFFYDATGRYHVTSGCNIPHPLNAVARYGERQTDKQTYSGCNNGCNNVLI